VHDRSGPARLLDVVAGRTAAALATWLAAQPADVVAAVQVIAMDGFAGYKTAAAQVIPDAVTVMDPFHVVALAGVKLDLICQRIQQQTLGAARPYRRSALRHPPHRQTGQGRAGRLDPAQFTRGLEEIA
jgi:transposase